MRGGEGGWPLWVPPRAALHLVVGGDPCVSIGTTGTGAAAPAEFGLTPSAERRGRHQPLTPGRARKLRLRSCARTRQPHAESDPSPSYQPSRVRGPESL